MAKYRPNISRLYPQKQVPRPNIYDLANQQDQRRRMQGGGGVSASDASVQAVLDRGTAQGYILPTQTTVDALDALVSGLKTDSIWATFDVFYVFATDGDRSFARINYVTPSSFECTESGTLTFTSLEGFTGNGSDGRLDTNYVPSTNAVNLSLDSANYGAYVRDLGTAGTIRGILECTQGTSFSNIRLTNTNVVISCVHSSNLLNLRNNSPVAGLYTVNRSASNAVQLYTNGSSTDTDVDTSSSLSSNNLKFINWQTSYGDNQISIGFAGSSLDVTAQGNLFTRIETYMDAIGKGVVA